MTAREFLQHVRGIDRRIEHSIERAERIRAKLEAGRMSRLNGLPRGGGEDWTATADKLMELERDINARTREMCRLKRLALEAVEQIEEARLREVLELYYIDAMTWSAVAERMDVSIRHVQRLNGIALQRFRVPKEFRECHCMSS